MSAPPHRDDSSFDLLPDTGASFPRAPSSSPAAHAASDLPQSSAPLQHGVAAEVSRPLDIFRTGAELLLQHCAEFERTGNWSVFSHGPQGERKLAFCLHPACVHARGAGELKCGVLINAQVGVMERHWHETHDREKAEQKKEKKRQQRKAEDDDEKRPGSGSGSPAAEQRGDKRSRTERGQVKREQAEEDGQRGDRPSQTKTPTRPQRERHARPYSSLASPTWSSSQAFHTTPPPASVPSSASSTSSSSGSSGSSRSSPAGVVVSRSSSSSASSSPLSDSSKAVLRLFPAPQAEHMPPDPLFGRIRSLGLTAWNVVRWHWDWVANRVAVLASKNQLGPLLVRTYMLNQHPHPVSVQTAIGLITDNPNSLPLPAQRPGDRHARRPFVRGRHQLQRVPLPVQSGAGGGPHTLPHHPAGRLPSRARAHDAGGEGRPRAESRLPSAPHPVSRPCAARRRGVELQASRVRGRAPAARVACIAAPAAAFYRRKRDEAADGPIPSLLILCLSCCWSAVSRYRHQQVYQCQLFYLAGSGRGWRNSRSLMRGSQAGHGSGERDAEPSAGAAAADAAAAVLLLSELQQLQRHHSHLPVRAARHRH